MLQPFYHANFQLWNLSYLELKILENAQQEGVLSKLLLINLTLEWILVEGELATFWLPEERESAR